MGIGGVARACREARRPSPAMARERRRAMAI
jgi:hypothetical protein